MDPKPSDDDRSPDTHRDDVSLVDLVALELLMQGYTTRDELAEAHARNRWVLPAYEDLRQTYRARARVVLALVDRQPLPDWLAEVLHVVLGFARREHERHVLTPAHARLALTAVPVDVLERAGIPAYERAMADDEQAP